MSGRACATCGAIEGPNVRHGIVGSDLACAGCYGTAHKAAAAARKASGKANGLAYWTSRGIAVGSPVTVFGCHLVFGRMAIHGTAEIGAAGAYVKSPAYPRRPLDPAGAVARIKESV